MGKRKFKQKFGDGDSGRHMTLHDATDAWKDSFGFSEPRPNKTALIGWVQGVMGLAAIGGEIYSGTGKPSFEPSLFTSEGWDPARCANASAGETGQEKAGCMVQQLGIFLAAEKIMEKFFKFPFVAMKDKMMEAVTNSLTKTSEEIATNVAAKEGGEGMLASSAETMGEDAALDLEMGPVGAAAMMLQMIGMVMDLGDPENYHQQYNDDQINGIAGSILLAMKKHDSDKTILPHIYKQMGMDPESLHGQTKGFIDNAKSMRDCISCKTLRWPKPALPFDTHYSVKTDPYFSRKVQDYMIDCLHFAKKEDKDEKWKPRR